MTKAAAKKETPGPAFDETNKGTILDPNHDAHPDGTTHGERLDGMKGPMTEVVLLKDAKVDIDGETDEYEAGSVLEVPHLTAIEMIRHGVATGNAGDESLGEKKPKKAVKKSSKKK